MTKATGIANLITDPIFAKTQDIIVNKVISKWRDHRANVFYKALIQEVANEYAGKYQSQELDQILEKLLTNPKSEDLLFEAYRRVCLSASKDLGPRIIALLTVRLLFEDRIASEDEESIFILAEEMRDVEFMEFCNFFEKENLETNLEKSTYNYPMATETLNLESQSKATPTTHLSPVIMIGKWAGKLEKVGFLYGDTTTDVYTQSSVYNEEKVPAIKYHISVVFNQEVRLLHEYVRRAQGPNS